MKSFKICILLVISLLSGCATYHQPAFNLTDDTRVGYHIDLHEEIGITKKGSMLRIIGESTKHVEGLNWNLQKHAAEEMERILRKYRFTPVDVSEVLMTETSGLYVRSKQPRLLRQNEVKEISAMYESAHQKYMENYRVKAVVNLVGKPVVVSRGDNSVTWGPYHGYFYITALTKNTAHHVMLAAYDDVFLLDPPQRVVNWEGPYKNRDIYENHYKEIPNFEPSDGQNLTASEWSQVETELKNYITEKIEANVRALRAGADGQGGYAREI